MTWCHYLLCQHHPKALISQNHVYCRDIKKWSTQMYCIKTKTSYCLQPRHTSSTHRFVHWLTLRHVHNWWEVPDKCFVLIFTTVWVIKILSARCGWNLSPGLLWVNQHWVQNDTRSRVIVCVCMQEWRGGICKKNLKMYSCPDWHVCFTIHLMLRTLYCNIVTRFSIFFHLLTVKRTTMWQGSARLKHFGSKWSCESIIVWNPFRNVVFFPLFKTLI